MTSLKSIKIILKCSFTLIESHTAIKWAHCNRVKKFIFIFHSREYFNGPKNVIARIEREKKGAKTSNPFTCETI